MHALKAHVQAPVTADWVGSCQLIGAALTGRVKVDFYDRFNLSLQGCVVEVDKF